MTLLDGCLSTGVLTAPVLNVWRGWWWTHGTAALLVASFAINQGVDHWREFALHEESEADDQRGGL